MKRKISLIIVMMLVLGSFANVWAKEDSEPNDEATESIEAELTGGILELSMENAVNIAAENDREMWKIDDGIRQMKNARRDGRDARRQAEMLIDMPLAAISAMNIDITSNYVDTLLAKNGYYEKYADTQMEQLEKSRELLVKGIEIETKSLYYNVLLSEKAIEINEVNLNKAEEQLRVVNLKFNNGTATKAEVLNGEMAVQQAKTDLDSAIDDLNISKLNLLNKLNLHFEQEIVLTDTELTYIPTAEINLNAAIERAKEERPEILTAKNNLELQKIETHVNKAYYTSNLRQHQAAEEMLKDAELNVPQAYKDVEVDVRKSYLNLIKAERTLANMEKTLELAKEAARINKLLYDNGMATSLDVLEANAGLAQAEIGHYQLLASYNITKLIFDNSNLIGSK